MSIYSNLPLSNPNCTPQIVCKCLCTLLLVSSANVIDLTPLVPQVRHPEWKFFQFLLIIASQLTHGHSILISSKLVNCVMLCSNTDFFCSPVHEAFSLIILLPALPKKCILVPLASYDMHTMLSVFLYFHSPSRMELHATHTP